jgi:spermidine synthase
MRWFFLFFFFSGLCSLLYEVIWLRLGMAQFGVTTALISLFLSIFLAGLGLGSWGFGKLARRLESRQRISFLRGYALTELLIGISAIIVPAELLWARRALDRMDNGAALGMGVAGYYVLAGLLLSLILLPWCTAMGATFPLAMAAIRRSLPDASERSFSFLYVGNVLGAIIGALLPAFVLVELLGFRASLRVGMIFNFLIAAAALVLSFQATNEAASLETAAPVVPAAPADPNPRHTLALLFLVGFISLAMEVVWIRQFTPHMGTAVWAFATILAVYLAGTFAGSRYYRRWVITHDHSQAALVWALLGIAGLWPLFMADWRLPLYAFFRIALGITAFTALAGFLTPMLVDRYSAGDPERAGMAYAANVVGCILGPLFSGFLLLPRWGERGSLLFLSLPLFLFVVPLRADSFGGSRRKLFRFYAEAAAFVLAASFLPAGFEDKFRVKVVRRDYAATVVAANASFGKQLFVNGIGITKLTPITKMMAHLPLAFMQRPPQNGLVICFGMGTTYRSMLSWGIPSTVAELLPSVPKTFTFFHADGDQVLASPLSHVVIDDGRLFLERTDQQFDVITIDPPPPVEAAGSSLLYSRDFYTLIKKRLRPGGILQQWYAVGDRTDIAAVARALKESFPHVRTFISIEGWGVHFLASMSPIPDPSSEVMAQRMPPGAVRDLVEWGPFQTPRDQFESVVRSEVPLDVWISFDPKAPALADDAPINEYYLLRSWRPTQALARFFNARRLSREQYAMASVVK